MATLTDQLAALATMSPAQPRTEWRQVHQAPPSPRLVPEPATWALMITGFGMVGVASRKRKPVAA